jgi:hypothetical protein
MALTKKEIYARHKERYHNDPEYKAKILAQKAQYYQNKKANDPNYIQKRQQYNKTNKDYFCKKAKEYNAARPFHYAFNRLRQRANRNNLPFDLDEEYLVSLWTGFCAIFGTPLQLPYSTAHQVPDKATIDKVVPELGYVKGNVQWVSNRANIIKSFGNADEHSKIAEYIRQNSKKHI